MIKPKAPKDMTAVEFVDGFIAMMNDLEITIYEAENLRDYLSMPAPNPFTPDQLAWMREEQRDGYLYAATDWNKRVFLYRQRPTKHGDNWEANGGHEPTTVSFLMDVVKRDDPEPLCFADYAPLEEKK